MCYQKYDKNSQIIDYISSLGKLSQDSSMKITYIHKQENKKKKEKRLVLYQNFTSDISITSHPPGRCSV